VAPDPAARLATWGPDPAARLAKGAPPRVLLEEEGEAEPKGGHGHASGGRQKQGGAQAVHEQSGNECEHHLHPRGSPGRREAHWIPLPLAARRPQRSRAYKAQAQPQAQAQAESGTSEWPASLGQPGQRWAGHLGHTPGRHLDDGDCAAGEVGVGEPRRCEDAGSKEDDCVDATQLLDDHQAYGHLQGGARGEGAPAGHGERYSALCTVQYVFIR